MNGSPADLCARIARLIEEKGWNQDTFARQAHLSRLTVRQIFTHPERRLHNATVQAVAQALGLSVHDLKTEPLPVLLERIRGQSPTPAVHRPQFESALQPELRTWLERNPDRAAQLSTNELEELLSLQTTGSPLTPFSIAHFVERLERRRRIVAQVSAICGTEYVDLLEQLVGLLYEKIQPYADRIK